MFASEEPMAFSIYLQNRLLPNMFASSLPQIVTFLSWLLKSGLVMLYCYLSETTIMPVTNSSSGGFTQDWGKEACGKQHLLVQCGSLGKTILQKMVFIQTLNKQKTIKTKLVIQRFWYIILRDQRILSCLKTSYFQEN